MASTYNFHKSYNNGMEPPAYLAAGYKLGAPTSPQTANQIEQFGLLLNQGMQNIEVSTISPEVFETIPKEHFKEIARLSKLGGATPALHAPLIEPSGFAERAWSEEQRRVNENHILSIVERAHDLDERGNVPVNLHGANIFGAEWEHQLKTAEGIEVPRAMAIVNQDNGQITTLMHEEKERFGQEKPETWDVYRRLNSLNKTEWDQEKLKIMSMQKEIFELEDRKTRIEGDLSPLFIAEKQGVIRPEEKIALESGKQSIQSLGDHVQELKDVSRVQFEEMYHKFKKFSDKKDEGYLNFVKHAYPYLENNFKAIDEQKKKIEGEFREGLSREEIALKRLEWQELQNQQTDTLTKSLARMPSPDTWKPVNEFALEQAPKTLSNVAFKSFEKFGEKAPIICVENSYPQMPLSRAEDLNKAIETTRKEFAKQLVEKKHISREKAAQIAEKLIGATWDIGHINMLRRGGYPEEKIIEETEKIKEKVKRVHATDNFGYTDSHLPPGMGNVPPELLKKLQEQAKQIIVEAGGYVQHFKQSPWGPILQNLGSPLYSIGGAPYWSQAMETYAPYEIGYGRFLPERNFALYGAGFSGLPRELGGEMETSERGRLATSPAEAEAA